MAPPPAPASWKDATFKIESYLDEAVQRIMRMVNMQRVVVEGATLVCSATVPVVAINHLMVERWRPQVEGRAQAHIQDNVRDENIRPWPCQCRLRPKGDSFLPCDYKPAGPWDPGALTEQVEGSLPGISAKAKEVFHRLLQEGFSRDQAAGIVGNLQVESKDFTTYHEEGVPENQGGVGWAQWTASRRRAFESWASTNCPDEMDLEAYKRSDQASYDFLVYEMKKTGEWNSMMKKKGAANAATYFMNNYEAPGVPHLDRRIENATKLAGVRKEKALIERATLSCTYKGRISIVDPGQGSRRVDPGIAKKA